MLDTKWDAWKGAARISLREYISSSVSGCLIGDPGLRAARISKPAIRFLREGWKGIGRNFIYSGGGRKQKFESIRGLRDTPRQRGRRGEVGERITRMIGTVKWKCNLLVAERSSEFKSSVNALIEKRATNETCSAPTIPSVSIEKHPLLSVAIFRIPIKSAYRAIIGAYLYHRWLISGIIYPSIRLDTTFPLR